MPKAFSCFNLIKTDSTKEISATAFQIFLNSDFKNTCEKLLGAGSEEYLAEKFLLVFFKGLHTKIFD